MWRKMMGRWLDAPSNRRVPLQPAAGGVSVLVVLTVVAGGLLDCGQDVSIAGARETELPQFSQNSSVRIKA